VYTTQPSQDRNDVGKSLARSVMQASGLSQNASLIVRAYDVQLIRCPLPPSDGCAFLFALRSARGDPGLVPLFATASAAGTACPPNRKAKEKEHVLFFHIDENANDRKPKPSFGSSPANQNPANATKEQQNKVLQSLCRHTVSSYSDYSTARETLRLQDCRRFLMNGDTGEIRAKRAFAGRARNNGRNHHPQKNQETMSKLANRPRELANVAILEPALLFLLFPPPSNNTPGSNTHFQPERI